MEFGLLDYSPEAQLELMNTMLQLEQLTALDGHHHHQSPPMAPVSPPISPPMPQTHCFSPPPHVPTTTTTTTTTAVYPAEHQFTPPVTVFAAGAGGLEHHLQDHFLLQQSPEYVLRGGSGSPSPTSTSSADAMREAIFHIAALQPVVETDGGSEAVPRPPKRRNVRISKDPQSVAARLRRERISERIRTLQRLVPGGTKMDTASMLDEAIHYVKFLKSQVQSLERAAATHHHRATAAHALGGAYPAFHAPWQQYALPHHGGADM